MGFLDNFFKTKVTNPVLISAMEAYASNASEENTADLWQKLMKSKVLLATTMEGRSSFGKIKQIRDAISLPFTTQNSDKGEIQFAVFTDNEALEKFSDSTAFVAMNGDQVLLLAAGKGINALLLNPGSSSHLELRCWQHTVFVEKASDTGKLHALATKFTRAGLNIDAEGVLKAAISVAQKDPGPQHPITAELNLELARSMRTQGKLTEAEWVYRRALSIYEISGSHDLDVAGTSEALGTLYIENKKAALATPLLTRALEIYENVPGGKPDCIGRILCQLAEIKLDEKNATEAEQYYKRAALTLEEKNHPDFAAVVNKLGALCETEQRPQDALPHYMRTLSVAENMKRMRPMDIATAAHRAGAIHTAAKQFAEAEPLMNRAMEIYQKEASSSNLAAIGALFNELAEAKAQAEIDRLADAEQQSSRPRYGVSGKKPSELPLLDMSSMKNQPRATYAGQSPTEDKVKEPLNSEDEALQRMRAFLDNVDKLESITINEELSFKAGAEAVNDVQQQPNSDFEAPVHSDFEAPVHRDFEAPVHSDFEAPVHSDFEAPVHSDFESPAHSDFKPTVGADLETTDRSDFEHRTESDSQTNDLFNLEGQVHNDEVAALLHTDVEAEIQASTEDLIKTAIDQPGIGAPPDVDASPKAEAESAESSLLSLLEETLVDDSVGVDELFASSKRNAADAAAAATGVDELIASSKRNAAAAAAAYTAAADSLSTAIPVVQETAPSAGADSKIFEKPVDGEISAVFNSSMIGPITRDGRYDKSLADRSAAEPPKEAAVPDASEQKKKNLFDASVAGEISYIFNKSILNEIDKTERYDKPISERIKPFVEEVEAAAAAKDEERADASSTVSDDEDLENSLTDAFKNLLAEPGKSAGADRFDVPISERIKSPPPAADRFDIPISERMKSPPPPPAPVVSREPVPAPVIEPAVDQSAENALFADDELDNSLNDAFNSLLGENKVGTGDRFDVPIAERKKSAAPAEAKAEQPAAAVIEPAVDQASENALFADDELDNSLNDAFNSLLGENKVGTGDRFDVPIAERKKSTPVDDRFDTPISERKKTAPEPQATVESASIDSENLDGSLNDAFANIFSESKTADDRFDKPIAERNSAPNTVATPSPAEAKPAPVAKIDESELAAAKTPEDLIRLLDLALQADPDNGDLWLRKGTALVQQQKLDEAIKVFDKVTKMCPNDIKAWYCKGSSLHLKNCFEDALYCFNHVLNLDKDNNKAMLRKAECLLKLGRSDQGMAIYDRLLSVQPKFIAGWSSKARALLQQRKLDEALACYEQVLAIDPSNEDATRARNLIATKIGATAAN